MKRVTINDVAEEAGVSRQTVSRAINDKSEISPETREQVLAVVERLGYRPNRAAQSMVTRRTRTLGMEVPDITNPFFAEVVRGAQRAAAEHDYNLFLCNSEDSSERAMHLLSSLVAQGVDGMLSFLNATSDADVMDFVGSACPLVLINREIDHPHISAVGIDIHEGARMATEHLIERGHSRIGMLSSNAPDLSRVRRVAGYRAAMQAHGLPTPEEWVEREPATLEGGYQATQRLLAAHPEITALFAYNDPMAIGALRAVQEMGRHIPEQFAIIGFDDIPLARMLLPALSTVHYDQQALGYQAATRLLEMIEAPEHHFDPILLPLTIIHRDTT